MSKPEPPRKLDPVAREVWDRQAARLERDGRWHGIDQEQLMLFAEASSLYCDLKARVDRDGSVIENRNGWLCRHPALTPMAQARADLIRLARSIPLVRPDHQRDADNAEIDRVIEMGRAYLEGSSDGDR